MQCIVRENSITEQERCSLPGCHTDSLTYETILCKASSTFVFFLYAQEVQTT